MEPALKRAKGTHFDISAKDVWYTTLKKGKWPWSNVPVFYMPEQNLDMRNFIKKPPISLSGLRRRLKTHKKPLGGPWGLLLFLTCASLTCLKTLFLKLLYEGSNISSYSRVIVGQ